MNLPDYKSPETIRGFMRNMSEDTFRVLFTLAREALDDPLIFDQMVDLEVADEQVLGDLRKQIDFLADCDTLLLAS